MTIILTLWLYIECGIVDQRKWRGILSGILANNTGQSIKPFDNLYKKIM